jgi:diguanylate cyclase (GGDEF)-like protein
MPDAEETAHADEQQPPGPIISPPLRPRTGAALGLAAAMAALAGAALLALSPSHALHAAVCLAVATLLLAAATAVRWFERRWRGPLLRLQHTLTDIREGGAAPDQLQGDWGRLTPLAARFHELLVELRQHRARLLTADLEMRQRLEQRTDALERMIGSLRQQANRDILTGLYNRRMLDRHLATVIQRTRQQGADLCLLMMDLDNFKLLNDTHGHAAGDELLRTVGQLIRSSIRESDMGFRCGGDEFVVVLPGAGRSCGEALARRLSTLVDALGRTLKLIRPVGLSPGLAVLSELGECGPTQLLEAADRNLYAAKRRRKTLDAGRQTHFTAPTPSADLIGAGAAVRNETVAVQCRNRRQADRGGTGL